MQAINPLIVATVIALVAVGTLRLAYRLAATNALAAAAVLALFATADLAWNNRPNESTGLPPSHYDALRPDTANETVALLNEKLAAAAPDRRDRVELIGIGYHWPNLSLVHGFDHLFGHNPLRLAEFARATNVADTVAVPDQRQFSPLLPSYNSALENLFGVRFIATGVPIEEIDKRLKPGDLLHIARTKDAYRLRKSACATARHADRRLAAGEFRGRAAHRPMAGRRSTPHGTAGACAASGVSADCIERRYGAHRRIP